MKKPMSLFLPIALLGLAASAGAEPNFAQLSNDKLLDDAYGGDQPMLSVADAKLAMERNVISCETDNMVGSHIRNFTACELVHDPHPVGTHYKFVLFQDGLYPMLCVVGEACTINSAVKFRSDLPGQPRVLSERSH